MRAQSSLVRRCVAQRRSCQADAMEGGRYGRVSLTSTFYELDQSELDESMGTRKRRAFSLGATRRAALNRSRQRLGLPPILNWRKFTAEAVTVREELCGLDDPRAQQHIERERKGKTGASHQHKGNPNLKNKKPFSKYAQTSSMQRGSLADHPVKRIMQNKRFRDCIAVSRLLNETNREAICNMQRALGKPAIHPNKIQYIPRAPVVTVMGHVDHGKTTLLDSLRNSDRAGGEIGGITQSVGAFQVSVPGSEVPITFIDTPGHAAFTTMRKAGINATDVVVMVVSAREGVQEQTIEVINLIKESGVPVVIALNKVDRVHDRDAALLQISAQLSAHDIILECDGGDVMHSFISAKTGEGIGQLLDNLLLQAELLELQTPTPCRAEASILETAAPPSEQSVGMLSSFSTTPTVTAIVRRGVLAPGMTLISNDQLVKITGLEDENGNPIKQAIPSQPCSIKGFGRNPPKPNTILVDAGRRINQKEWLEFWGELHSAKLRNEDFMELAENETMNLFWNPRPDIMDQALPMSQRRDQTETLRLILKGSSQGMVDAMEQAIQGLPRLDKVTPQIIHKGIGDINDNDGQLYQQRPEISQIVGCGVQDVTKEHLEHSPFVVGIIFELIDLVKDRMVDFYPLITADIETGSAICKNVFSFSKEKEGNVGGLRVEEGELNKGRPTKVMRNGEEVYRDVTQSGIKSLRHVKEEQEIIPKGMECGLILDGGFTFEEGDVIVQFKSNMERPTVEDIFAQHTIEDVGSEKPHKFYSVINA